MLTKADVVQIVREDLCEILEKCTGGEVKVLLDVIATFQNPDTDDIAHLYGGYTDSLEEISEVTGLSQQTVSSCLDSLCFKRYLTYELGKDDIIRIFPLYCEPTEEFSGEERRYAGFNTYRDYLKSAHWKNIRVKALEFYDGKCGFCHKGNVQFNVHHKNYDHLGEEEIPRDLVVLCTSCHRKFHGKQ